MAAIPEMIRVGGRDYRILYPHLFRDSTTHSTGQHDPAGQAIKLSAINIHGETRHPQAIWHNLLHEILHAIDYVYCGAALLEMGQTGEMIIDQLAEGLLQVLQDNHLECGKGDNGETVTDDAAQ